MYSIPSMSASWSYLLQLISTHTFWRDVFVDVFSLYNLYISLLKR